MRTGPGAINGPVPGTAFIANAAGVGKTLLADIIGHISYGTSVPTSAYPEDNIEARKVAMSLALAGKPFVLFDNLGEGATYGLPALDALLTSTELNDRLLGTMKTVTAPVRMQPMATGNNIAPSKDAHRRWTVCQLHTDLETPYEREDIEIPEILPYILDHRAEYLGAALTILVGHAKADRPPAAKAKLGKFENWDLHIRGAVKWATGLDPAHTMKEIARMAPERLNKAALIDAWKLLPHGQDEKTGHSAESAMKLAEGNAIGMDQVREIFCRLTRDGKPPSPRSLGKFLRGIENANLDNFAFRAKDGPNHTLVWYVEEIPKSGV